MTEKILLSWSGGKDSAFSLHELRKTDQFEVTALVTTVTEGYDRISMHGVRRTLLEQQAASLGIALEQVVISQKAGNEEYEMKMRALLERYLELGVTKVAFGDLFLEDIRKYRDENLAKIGMTGIYPLWRRDTAAMAHEFISLGFRAVICCVDSEVLDGSFAGRDFDEQLIGALPSTVDPCGEKGEFHSFVYDGPIFRWRIPVTKGEICLRDSRFYYCDLIPGEMLARELADNTATDSAPVSSIVAMIRVADVMNSAKFYRNLGFEIGNAVPREGPPFHWAWLYQPEAPNWKTGANLMLVSGEVSGMAEGKAKTVLFYLYARDLKSLREKLLAEGFSASEISYPGYLPEGEFRLQDPDGYTLMIAQSGHDTP